MVSVSLIAGPTHVLRWCRHVRNGVIDSPLAWERIIGREGAPIWHASLLRQAGDAAGDEGGIAVLVGDFRLGNGILLEDPLPSDALVDGFTGITAGTMTTEQERAMLRRWLSGIRAWHDEFGDRARYVMWDALGAQVHDRLAGRHIADGPYQHPVFNYDEIAPALDGLNVVDLSPLLRLPMHEVQRLFVDSSNCPSHVGYLLLKGLICDGLCVIEAYERAEATVEAELSELARALAEAAGRKVLLTGRSVWLDTLSRYMGATGAQLLAQAGLILAPLDRVPGQRTPAQMVEDVDLAQCSVAVVSAGGADLSTHLTRAFGTGAPLWPDAPVINWEQGVEAAISGRGGSTEFTRLDPNLPVRTDAISPTLRQSQIELGRSGTPSWAGIKEFLPRFKEDGWHRFISEKELWRVENEVLITRDGVAFLVGGNHHPLKYSIGELKPSPVSLRTFSDNIEARAQHAEARSISYAHVVFPDKQSILANEFPLHTVAKLGETYIAHASAPAAARIIYPADSLRAVDGACLPLDFHLSDTGSLEVAREMLDAVRVDCPRTLTLIEHRITKPRRWAGDLGGKLDPPLHQEALTLAPDWELIELNSGGGFNDGMIDILFSPNAPVNKTVLLFGDSFFRLMLKLLSGVFKRIICLRTRFYHREMVELINPDIVFSGNDERYLSHVHPDGQAIPFMLYRPLLGIVEQFDRDFLEGWRSVTSPRARESILYLERRRVGTGREPVS